MAIPLKSLRESKKMTQLELSKILRVSPSAVAMYERGQRSPDYETLKHIAKFFNVSTDYLLDNDSSSHIERNTLSLEEKDFLALYRSVPVVNRKNLLNLVKVFADSVAPKARTSNFST